jgi:hypothetical protein
MVMNPLHRLARKLTPVRTMMIRMMRPCFKVSFSISADPCEKPPVTDFLPSGALELSAGRGREFRDGVGKESFILVATNSVTDKRSDMMVLAECRVMD